MREKFFMESFRTSLAVGFIGAAMNSMDAAQAAETTSSPYVGMHDFDILVGEWRMHHDIFPAGTERTKSELLKFLSDADLKDYRLSNFRVSRLKDDAAVVTYHVDAHAAVGGNDALMTNSVTSGWAKRDRKWLNMFAVASAR
jgi:hypothetical protein